MIINALGMRQELRAKNLEIFSARDLGDVLRMKPRTTLYYLEKGMKEGLFAQLKRGLYCLKTDLPSEMEIANRLYQPSYVSFEYVLANCNVLPEMVYVVTSATTRQTREFNVEAKTFRYTTIKLAAYTGYELKTIGEKRYQIAEPEKALADYLYTVSLGRRALSERLNVVALKKLKVLNYAKLFDRVTVVNLVQRVFS